MKLQSASQSPTRLAAGAARTPSRAYAREFARNGCSIWPFQTVRTATMFAVSGSAGLSSRSLSGARELRAPVARPCRPAAPAPTEVRPERAGTQPCGGAERRCARKGGCRSSRGWGCFTRAASGRPPAGSGGRHLRPQRAGRPRPAHLLAPPEKGSRAAGQPMLQPYSVLSLSCARRPPPSSSAACRVWLRRHRRLRNSRPPAPCRPRSLLVPNPRARRPRPLRFMLTRPPAGCAEGPA